MKRFIELKSVRSSGIGPIGGDAPKISVIPAALVTLSGALPEKPPCQTIRPR
jgi:hypothetical protein